MTIHGNDDSTTISDLKQLMAEFVAERAWHPFHDPKNLSMAMSIEVGELMEHFQWLRSEELPAICNDKKKMAAIREEVADVAAYLLSFATVMKIDLSQALRDKMVKNALKYPVDEYHGRA